MFEGTVLCPQDFGVSFFIFLFFLSFNLFKIILYVLFMIINQLSFNF